MPAEQSARALRQFRAAMESGDVAAVVDSFAPDAVFHSPLTGRLAFTGSGQIGTVTEVVLRVFDDLRYTDEMSGDDTGYLVWRARVSGLEIESVDLLRFGPDGKIQEATAFFRPLPAAAAALRMIGTGLARKKSPARAAAVSVMAAPLAFFARTGDPVGVRLVS